MNRKLLLSLFVVLAATTVRADVVINATNFPDEHFRSWVLSQTYGSDGLLTNEEITTVNFINVNNLEVQSLKGIEFFTELTTLYCEQNKLTELDLSHNTKLTTLYCVSNSLTKLDVSGCAALTTLKCYHNRLSELDLSVCTELPELECYGNHLKKLDMSKNTKLKKLSCYSNQLESLNVSGCTALTDLLCSSNKMTELDLSNNIALTQLDCSRNQLAELDLSKNTQLKSLFCYGNQLIALDLSSNECLQSLILYQNRIRGAAMDTFVESLPPVWSGLMYVIYNENEQNEMTTVQVAVAKAKGWKPQEYNGSKWQEYEGSEPVMEDIAINETNFPDENFRNWVLSQTYGADGVLKEEEIAGVTSINVSSKGIQSLKGIDFFTSLKKLRCHNNQLTALDVSQNTALTELTCFKNQINEEAMGALVESLPTTDNGIMYVIWNKNEQNIMSSMQVAAAKAKGWVPYYRHGNSWQEYDGTIVTEDIAINETNFPDANFRNWVLSQTYGADGILTEEEIAGVTSISVSNKSIQDLKGIEHFTALTDLRCNENQLTVLNVSKNTKLTRLECDHNQLTSLDVSQNIALERLECRTNQLTSLDVSQNTALTLLNFYQNQINGASMNTLVESLPNVSYGSMLVIIGNNYEQNVMTTEQVAIAKAKGWSPQYILSLPGTNISSPYPGSMPVIEDITINETNFPDANFRNWVLNQSYGADGVLTDIERSTVHVMEVNDKSIQDIKGIEFFASLTVLYCHNNQLTALDASNNTVLTYLDCQDNHLTTLDVSNNSVLKSLYCSSNLLTALDVSQNTRLERLDCSCNRLTALNVSNNTDFTFGTYSIYNIICYKNQIKGAAMNALVESLPNENRGTLRVIYNTNEGNEMTTVQVAAAKAKGCIAYKYNGNDWQEYEGSEPVTEDIAINETNFPDANFRNWVLSQTYGADGVLTEEEIAGVTRISVSNKSIQNLKGIEYFTALKELDCGSNRLTALDVSKNAALIGLDCYSNQLILLDVSHNTALTSLICRSNLLTALDVSECSALEYLDCNRNLLTSLNVSQNTALEVLHCERNQLTALDVSGCTELIELKCESNQLTALDISNITVLEELECNMNLLTSLDVSNNTALHELECFDNLMTELDLSNNTKIEYISCTSNQLTTLDLSNNTALTTLYCGDNLLTELDLSKNTVLNHLSCWQNQIKGAAMDALVESMPIVSRGEMYVIWIENGDEQNAMTTKQVAAAKAKGWNVYAINDEYYEEYPGSESTIAINETNFPDRNFRNWLLKQSFGADKMLTESEIENITDIAVDGKRIQSLKGIEFFTALTTLSCFQNQIKGADMDVLVEGLPTVNEGKLYVIDSEDEENVITTKQVKAANDKGWTAYAYDGSEWLEYEGNEIIIAINETNFPDKNFRNWLLRQSYGTDAKLTEAEIESITSIIVDGRRIQSLKGIEFFTALTRLDCYQNQIKDEEMDALVEGLPIVEYGELYVIDSENEQNEITTEQVKIAKTKGWIVYKYDCSDWIEYEDCDDAIVSPFEDMEEGAIYDLSGRKVTGKLSTRGIYIVNGKKVLK